MLKAHEARQPDGGKVGAQGLSGLGQGGQLAVGGRQKDDVAGRLAEIDRLGPGVERDLPGAQEMHAHPSMAGGAPLSQSGRPATTRMTCSASAAMRW